MRKNAAKAARKTAKAPKPKPRFTVSDEAREAMRTVVIETIEALHIPELVRAAISSSNPPDPYAGSTVQAVGAGQPMSPPVPEDQFSLARRALEAGLKSYEAARSRWFKAQDQARKTSPLDPNYSSVMAELHYSTSEYVEASHTLFMVDTGVVFG